MSADIISLAQRLPLSQRLRRWRTERGLSHKQVAPLLGVHRNGVAIIERGDYDDESRLHPVRGRVRKLLAWEG